MNRILYFATGNSKKVREIQELMRAHAISVIQLNAKGKEIQSHSLLEIAEESARRAAQENQFPLFVEDSGLFIDELKGFPGPYTSYIYETIGLRGTLDLMRDKKSRRAEFRSVISFCSPGKEPNSFVGQTWGCIGFSSNGTKGFGFDPIFKPEGGYNRTFAEMDVYEKNLLSHRARAVRKFINWYIYADFKH